MVDGRTKLQLIRARQIRALYRRELTTPNRDAGIDDPTRRTRAESLWQQATAQLERVRDTLDVAALSEDERALFEPLPRPDYLEPPAT
jgi:hypothetical protein